MSSKERIKELAVEVEADQHQEVTIQGENLGANNVISQENYIISSDKDA